jgi:hypothetical protein
MPEHERNNSEEPEENFKELIQYTASGFAGGLIVVAGLDVVGLQNSPAGQ